MNLMKPKSADRKDSSFAYALNYYPFFLLSEAQLKLIFYKKEIWTTKHQLLSRCDETKCFLVAPKSDSLYKIHWAFNNIPTEEEWNKLTDCSTFCIEFRVSPACEGEGRVAIITPEILLYDKRSS